MKYLIASAAAVLFLAGCETATLDPVAEGPATAPDSPILPVETVGVGEF